MLKINNLTVSVAGNKILDNLNLEIPDGEIHAIMGHNGTGKSTLCRVILKDEEYEIMDGSIIYNDKDLTKMTTTEIAREKIFLLNQNPISIEGVSNAEMLRVALQEINEKPLSIFDFSKKMESVCQKLDLPESFMHREINVGMSGGERKKNELLQMYMLEPKLILLDEVDSGLDVDAINVVAKLMNDYYKEYKPTILIITHHDKILKLIKPNVVHILSNGKITKSGDISLAKKIEEQGFNGIN